MEKWGSEVVEKWRSREVEMFSWCVRTGECVGVGNYRALQESTEQLSPYEFFVSVLHTGRHVLPELSSTPSPASARHACPDPSKMKRTCAPSSLTYEFQYFF